MESNREFSETINNLYKTTNSIKYEELKRESIEVRDYLLDRYVSALISKNEIEEKIVMEHIINFSLSIKNILNGWEEIE